ncbi:MAG: type II secretion system protein [Thiomicrorhabdus chilensis]|uniref:type II secretion system protein n=1 Tax=Thiomicrorhabdus chilensis TaxID=63656 RepID=UPI00299EE80B|nr:type II secretion system protein [Thiomicrorhabdus chilensis]MDX1347182.1 type II secretion system protein [Thiomicrorhabdus chilensis]
MKSRAMKIQKGFTLVEIAIVLGIISILIGAGFSTVGAYIDNANQSHTMGNLQVTKRAMLDYVLVNRHMPCPDTDNDGVENREASFECTASKGTVPFDDIGLGFDVTSDEYGNVFAYGININATSAAAIADPTDSASYFGNQSPPAFDLQTPPTRDNPIVAESYTVCKKEATACNSTASNVEVSAIPAVIVAFNENGGATSLAACNAESGKEGENCDNDLLLWKSVFNASNYDDQMVTISGYEIKQQVLDLLNNISLTVTDSDYAGYEVIIRRDVDSANDLNVGNGEDNSFYIDTDDDGLGGNLDANVQLKDGEDKLKLVGNIKAGGNADMGQDNDDLYVLGTILLRGQATLGDGDDISEIGGAVIGEIDAGKGNDIVVIKGDVTGTVLMNNDDDKLYLYGDLAGGVLDGGSGTNELYTTKSEADWNQMLTDYGGTVTDFDSINYNYVPNGSELVRP